MYLYSSPVFGQSELCSSRVGLTDTPVPLPLGEVAAKQTERARTLPESLKAHPSYLQIPPKPLYYI